jgi:hypothetical protein
MCQIKPQFVGVGVGVAGLGGLSDSARQLTTISKVSQRSGTLITTLKHESHANLHVRLQPSP